MAIIVPDSLVASECLDTQLKIRIADTTDSPAGHDTASDCSIFYSAGVYDSPICQCLY